MSHASRALSPVISKIQTGLRHDLVKREKRKHGVYGGGSDSTTLCWPTSGFSGW